MSFVPPLDPQTPLMMCKNCRRPLEPTDHYIGKRYVNSTYRHAVEVAGVHCEKLEAVIRSEFPGSPVVVCDFCAAPGAEWTYPAQSFHQIDAINDSHTHRLTYSSTGDWACCDQCHDSIERNDWTEMANRAMLHRKGQTKADRRASRTYLMNFWDNFRRYRNGEAYRH